MRLCGKQNIDPIKRPKKRELKGTHDYQYIDQNSYINTRGCYQCPNASLTACNWQPQDQYRAINTTRKAIHLFSTRQTYSHIPHRSLKQFFLTKFTVHNFTLINLAGHN